MAEAKHAPKPNRCGTHKLYYDGDECWKCRQEEPRKNYRAPSRRLATEHPEVAPVPPENGRGSVLQDQAPPTTQEQEAGKKYDDGKMPWHLLPWAATERVVEVLAHGAGKYGPDNWRKVKPIDARYFSAAMRHLMAWRTGESLDPDSGLPHLAHAACCVLFLLEDELLNGRPNGAALRKHYAALRHNPAGHGN